MYDVFLPKKVISRYTSCVTPQYQNHFPFPKWPSLSLYLTALLLLWFYHHDFQKKKQKKLKWKKESEQLRMLGLPGCLLNNLMSLSLNSYVVFIVWIKGSWFVNYKPNSWSHKPKLCKTSSFHQLFFQNIFLKWSVQTIFVCLSRFKNERD